VVRYAHDDPEALERLLRRHPKAPAWSAWTASTR
jgi:7-keto-8-aminopelargonate synthetase-like enzyme